jgi:hypothetical protein
MPPKQWYHASPMPPAQHTSSSYYPPLQPPVFGWFLCMLLLIGGHLKAAVFFILILLSLLLTPQTMQQHPTPCSATATPPLQYHCYHRHQLSVDYGVSLLNGSHLKPEPGASLYFLMGLFLAPQMKQPTATRVSPMRRVCYGPTGSREAKI